MNGRIFRVNYRLTEQDGEADSDRQEGGDMTVLAAQLSVRSGEDTQDEEAGAQDFADEGVAHLTRIALCVVRRDESDSATKTKTK